MAEGGNHVGHHGMATLGVAHVAGKPEVLSADGCSGGGRRICIQVEQHNARPFFGEAASRGPADAPQGGCAGHDGDFVFEKHGNLRSRRAWQVYWAVHPPSTSRQVPVTMAAAGEAR